MEAPYKTTLSHRTTLYPQVAPRRSGTFTLGRLCRSDWRLRPSPSLWVRAHADRVAVPPRLVLGWAFLLTGARSAAARRASIRRSIDRCEGSRRDQPRTAGSPPWRTRNAAASGRARAWGGG